MTMTETTFWWLVVTALLALAAVLVNLPTQPRVTTKPRPPTRRPGQ